MPAGRILIILGIALVIAGLAVTYLPVGRIPGDIHIRVRNTSFYFPLGTSLLLSAVLTLLFWLLRR